MADLFFYGTLCHRALLDSVLGRALPEAQVQAAVLPGHAARWVRNEAFPIIVAQDGAEAAGLLVTGLSGEDVARLDFYEGGFGYGLREVQVQSAQGPAQAQVYFPDPGLWETAGPWDLQAWARDHAPLIVPASAEFMRLRGRVSPEVSRQVWPFIQARVWGWQLGREGAPTTLRRDTRREAVRFELHGDGHEGFFALRQFEVAFPRFDGSMTDPVTREGFVAFDAALVLPYDPQSDSVLLVEQLRYGPLLRDDPHPWVLEPIAGLVDAGEDPETCIRREAQEEAGLALRDVELMTRVYASPGYSSEFFHCYLGLADLDRATGTVAGLASETEDIRSHILPFDDAMALLDSGEINAGPLAMMLLWLARHRARLRAAG